MAGQARAGKAFEYAILIKSFEILSTHHSVNIIQNNSLLVAQTAFNSFSLISQSKYRLAAEKGIYHILTLEPRLNNPVSTTDVLNIQLAQDSEGIEGDVRDILFSRSLQNWEIGISAKNNHCAVKHSRLSGSIDFGSRWYGINCSESYWQAIESIFIQLKEYKNNGILWRDLPNKMSIVYVPLLNAFKNEIVLQNTNHPGVIPERLLKYLLGSKDFYKVIKSRKITSVFGFNLHGLLNKVSGTIQPNIKVSRVRMPTIIDSIRFSPTSPGTINISFDQGWQISFRIHNASSIVEPSLKFDINIIGQPPNLYTQNISWD